MAQIKELGLFYYNQVAKSWKRLEIVEKTSWKSVMTSPSPNPLYSYLNPLDGGPDGEQRSVGTGAPLFSNVRYGLF